MGMIRNLLKSMNKGDRNAVYLREIALLMEQIDSLRVQLEVKENLIKNYQKQIGEKKE